MDWYFQNNKLYRLVSLQSLDTAESTKYLIFNVSLGWRSDCLLAIVENENFALSWQPLRHLMVTAVITGDRVWYKARFIVKFSYVTSVLFLLVFFLRYKYFKIKRLVLPSSKAWLIITISSLNQIPI